MLISILYNGAGRLVAAAPACDQIAEGDRYWVERLNLPICNTDPGETGVHHVRNIEMMNRLLHVLDDPETLESVRWEWERYCRVEQLRSGKASYVEGQKPGSKLVLPRAA